MKGSIHQAAFAAALQFRSALQVLKKPVACKSVSNALSKSAAGRRTVEIAARERQDTIDLRPQGQAAIFAWCALLASHRSTL